VAEKNKVKKKTMRGTVVSDNMDKTIVVKFQRTYKDPRTKKNYAFIEKI